MPDVALETMTLEQQPTLANLLQLYAHDFSDFWVGKPQGEVGEDGLFSPYPDLDAYWTQADREPMLIRADGAVAGFVMVNTLAHSGLSTDYSMAEFFVLRKYRRRGIGQAAAVDVIKSRPGQWDIAVRRANTPAQAFWRRVAAAAAEGEIEERDQCDERWNGLSVRFRSAR